MGYFRFYRRARIFPGLSLNISKSGPSVTMGMKGFHWTVGPRGVRRTIGLPGTGLYYTSQSGTHTGVHSRHSDLPLTAAQQGHADRAVGCLVIGVVILVVLVIGIIIGGALSAAGTGSGAAAPP
ncbi:MAG TPA: DUF4236 domain-containing protein [Gemmatimonadaceae bacterium]|jgi:hypothetical protein|nr:DUF4236 domain-containing protein [Gemmatimonadaceae bacterium]